MCPAKLDIHIKCWLATAHQEKLTSCLDSMDIIPKNVGWAHYCVATVYETFSGVATVQRYLVRVTVTPRKGLYPYKPIKVAITFHSE